MDILHKYTQVDYICMNVCNFREEIIIRQAIILSHRGVDRKLYCRNAAANIVIIFCMD